MLILLTLLGICCCCRRSRPLRGNASPSAPLAHATRAYMSPEVSGSVNMPPNNVVVAVYGDIYILVSVDGDLGSILFMQM